jgi:hypothetical protein
LIVIIVVEDLIEEPWWQLNYNNLNLRIPSRMWLELYYIFNVCLCTDLFSKLWMNLIDASWILFARCHSNTLYILDYYTINYTITTLYYHYYILNLYEDNI